MAIKFRNKEDVYRIFAFIHPTLSLEIALNKIIDGTPAKGWFGIMLGCSFSVRVDLQIPFMLGDHSLTF